MTPNQIIQGDALEVLRTWPDACIDSVVTDPPYGLRFMGKKWDYDVPSVELWQEVLRVMKPGSHLLAFAGTRTQHRMAVNIEDAGFEIRDMLAWVYGSGFPKSMNVANSIHDAEIGQPQGGVKPESKNHWQGWGTALKPAMEMITLARKPLIGTVAENVLKHGTGGLNIDECRIGASSTPRKDPRNGKITNAHMEMRPWMKRRIENGEPLKGDFDGLSGRFPSNFIHDGSDEVLALFPETTSGAKLPHHKSHESENRAMSGKNYARGPQFSPGSTGSAARFFYVPKADKAERGEENGHPTVKPIDLIKYLIRLITPPGGIVLDCFAGSGTTAIAAHQLGFNWVLIEREQKYVEDIIKPRIKRECTQLHLFQNRTANA